ncbi:MAG TPA: VWA domain-containing protein [Thiotrichales bacterium]|nr:VWA domain-containing protein [Thiotrichales bacterium]
MRETIAAGLTGLLLIVQMLLASVVQAAGVPTDAVLIIDSSGSMKRTDPNRLRVPAAKLFSTLLGNEDRLGVISFSDAGYPVVHLTPTDDAHRQKIEQGIEKVSARGAYTNLHAALAKGLEMLEKESRPERRRLLLLFSDGKMDTGDAERDERLAAELFSELVPRLREAGIRLYTIAFTEASDLELMDRLARATGGISRLASNDRRLHEVFSAIFETAKQPDMLPIENGEFLVDDAVSEFTVVASKARPDVHIVLEMPDGRRIAAVNAGRAVRWFQSDLFDMITVKGPPPGIWKLLAADAQGTNRAYIVTDLGLEARMDPETPQQDGVLTISAWLKQGDARLTQPAILAATGFSARLVPSEGEARIVPLADSGVSGDEEAGDARFANQIRLATSGPHEVRVIAVGKTFRREKVLHFDAAPAPEAPASSMAAPDAEEEERPPVEPLPEPRSETAAEATDNEATETAESPAGDPGPVQEETLLPEETEEPPSLWTILATFLVINLVISGGVFGWLRWRNRRRGESAEPDPADLSWLDEASPETAATDDEAGEDAADGGSAEASASDGDSAIGNDEKNPDESTDAREEGTETTGPESETVRGNAA